MKKIQLLLISFVFTLLLIPLNNLFAQVSNNVQKNETIGPENGSLLIVGGGNLNQELWAKFKELMGGADKHLVVVPTARTSDTLNKEYIDNYKNGFMKMGFKNVSVLHTRDRAESNSDSFIEILDSASGVWLSGGRQWRYADSYLNTKTHEALKKVLDRGGVIAGTSAGATIQGSYLARGDSKTNIILMGDHEEGFGFIKNTAIDQHVLARNRQNDMFKILDNKPELLGIGIDESTAIVVNKNKFSVIGESYVAIYDGTRWSKERDTIYQLPSGSREYYWLKAGDEYNLKTRSVITYKNREFIQLPESELKKYCGTYQLVGNNLKAELFINNGSLFSKVNDETYPLLSETVTRFYIPQSDIYLDFILDSSGEILKAIIPAQNQTWEKMK